MTKIEQFIHTYIELLIGAPFAFGLVWAVSFGALFGGFAAAGWVPDSMTSANDAPVVLAANTEPEVIQETVTGGADNPVRIIIDKAGVDVAISNPASRDIEVLNDELKHGAVRYPGSGGLEDTSNLFLFGHSSYLPEVINKSYQAFNGIEDLEAGDVIRVQSATKEYVYKVSSVELVDAEDAWVELSTTHKKLTLSTCDVFGKKQNRYVVEADFVGSYGVE